MASVVVCDVCGKELVKPFYKLRVLKAELNQESRDMKTAGNFDFHERCFVRFQEWLKKTKAEELAK
jgi:hypothetical protein